MFLSKLCLQSRAEPMCPTSFALPDESSSTSHRAVAVVVAADWPVLSGGSVVKKTDNGQNISGYKPHFDSVSIVCLWKVEMQQQGTQRFLILKRGNRKVENIDRKRPGSWPDVCCISCTHPVANVGTGFGPEASQRSRDWNIFQSIWHVFQRFGVKHQTKSKIKLHKSVSVLLSHNLQSPAASSFRFQQIATQRQETTWWQCESMRQAEDKHPRSGKEWKMVRSWKSQGNYQVPLLYNKRNQTWKIWKAQRGTSAAPDFAKMCPPASPQKPLWWTLVCILYCI